MLRFVVEFFAKLGDIDAALKAFGLARRSHHQTSLPVLEQVLKAETGPLCQPECTFEVSSRGEQPLLTRVEEISHTQNNSPNTIYRASHKSLGFSLASV